MPQLDAYTDAQAACLFQEGKKAGFAHFFRAYYPALTLYAAKITGNQPAAEDIATNTFVNTWSQHAKLGTAGSIRAYLFRVARNEAVQWLRCRKKEKALQAELAYLNPTPGHTPYEEALLAAELARLLQYTLGQLPPACRAVLGLLYGEGKTVRETARILQLSPNTVKSQRKKGLQLLRKNLPPGFGLPALLWALALCGTGMPGTPIV